jgi:hypothetical protein
MELRAFQRRLLGSRCWIDDAPTHASHAGQRQCTQCRRKWSFATLQRHWQLAKFFCAPGKRKFERDRKTRPAPDNFGPGRAFTVSQPDRQVIDRIHAAVLLECGHRVAGRTIARERKTAINAHPVGRIYTTFEILMLVEYFFDDRQTHRESRIALLERAGRRATRAAADSEEALQDALRNIAARHPKKFREIVEPALEAIWTEGFGGYVDRLAILYRRYFAPKLEALGVQPFAFSWDNLRGSPHLGPLGAGFF